MREDKQPAASGIYAIYNIENCRMYVGSSVRMDRRQYDHLWQLRKNKHHSRYLQHAWNKHGEESFRFGVIELCSPEELLERERFWVSELTPEYNLMEADRAVFKHSSESIAKRTATRKSRGVNMPRGTDHHAFTHGQYANGSWPHKGGEGNSREARRARALAQGFGTKVRP
jgi:group I intron endonuclease